jgi:hypothetical protein
MSKYKMKGRQSNNPQNIKREMTVIIPHDTGTNPFNKATLSKWSIKIEPPVPLNVQMIPMVRPAKPK